MATLTPGGSYWKWIKLSPEREKAFLDQILLQQVREIRIRALTKEIVDRNDVPEDWARTYAETQVPHGVELLRELAERKDDPFVVFEPGPRGARFTITYPIPSPHAVYDWATP